MSNSRRITTPGTSAQSSPDPKPKLYESMTRIYSGAVDTLQNPSDTDDLFNYTNRIATIEERMEKERTNTHRYTMDDFKAFRTLRSHRIVLNQTRASLKDSSRPSLKGDRS